MGEIIRKIGGSLLIRNIMRVKRFVFPQLNYSQKIQKYKEKYQSRIDYNQVGHDQIAQFVAKEDNFLISRIGHTELAALKYYLKARNGQKKPKPYPVKIKQMIQNNAGFFPATDTLVDDFCKLYIKSIKEVDLMGVWFNDGEWTVCKEFCPGAKLVEIGCLEAFRWKNPWSSLLKGRKVLVVHPFVETIESQYRRHQKQIFRDPEVLPEFELKTIKAVQSIAGVNSGFTTWFEAYESMCHQIDSVEFDIALIGAGAYGLPLGAHVKRLGKSAIHLGGVTQMFFGIIGKRWECEYTNIFQSLVNSYWVRPSDSEKPVGFNQVESGCYW